MTNDDFHFKNQLFSNIRAIEELLATNVFGDRNLNTFREPVFISLIIKLRDLLQKVDSLGGRITFRDDIEIQDTDVTDLVVKIRDAICHLDSKQNFLKDETSTKFVFNTISGKNENAFIINGKTFGSSYEDDVAIYYGEYRIYLKRHILKILSEVKTFLKGIYPDYRL